MIRPVGGHEEISIDVRILSATHKDLAERVKSGDFREDLYYRLNVIELNVPPLRDRKNDIQLLAEYILKNIANKNAIAQPSFTQGAIDALNNYSFPGNVRELENILERALTWAEGDIVDVDDLMLPSTDLPKESQSFEVNNISPDLTNNEQVSMSVDNDLGSQLEQQERELIKNALESTRWNKTAAAKKLGITFRALRYKLKKLNLE